MTITNDDIAQAIAGTTVTTNFLETVSSRPDAVALRWTHGGAERITTWAEYAEQATRLAAALTELGVRPGDRVVLLMRNRPEFHVADVATLLVGATPISIYNSSSPEQIRYLAQHCGAQVAIVEDAEFLERLLEVRDDLPQLAHVVVIDEARGVPDRRGTVARAPRSGTRRARDRCTHRDPERPRHRDLHVGHDR